MKKRLFITLAVICIMVASIIPMALPAQAQGTGNSVDISLSIMESTALPTDTVHYIVTLFNNPAVADANPAMVNATFSPPGHTGAIGAYGAPIPLVTGLLLNVGDTVTFNYNGSGGAAMIPGLAVNLGLIPLDAGVAVAYADANFVANYVHTPAYSGSGDKNIPLILFVPNPNTLVTVAASPPSLPIGGGNVSVTVTEKNTGNVPLNSVSVAVTSTPNVLNVTLNKNSSGFSGDNGNGILDMGETWQWVIPTVAVTAATTFTATGTGTAPSGAAITYPQYGSEQAQVVVPLLQLPASSNLTLVILIVGLAGLMGLLVLRRPRQFHVT